jgi:cell division control protein 7
MVARLASIANGTKRLQVRVLRWSFFFLSVSDRVNIFPARDGVSPQGAGLAATLASTNTTAQRNCMESYRTFSQHSSNPLELPSSDVRNKTALHRYRKARAMAGNQRDSDEPEDDLEVSDLKNYQKHVAGLLHERPAPGACYTTRGNADADALIDLDDDLDGDREPDYDGEHSDESQGDIDIDPDADGEIDEEMSLYLKPQDEQEEIELEIEDLEQAVPSITQDYKLIDRLGTGTFSSVYKAIDLGYHEKWDNSVWHGLHPCESSAHYQSALRPPGTKIFVAIKRIYVTSNPERIRNEISILETCRGARHVSQLITAFRHEDQVVVIMPYHPHEDFRVRIRNVICLREVDYTAVILSHASDGRGTSVLQVHVSCIAGYSRARHHSP